MGTPTLTQKEYRRLKGRLTRVINQKDTEKIITEVDYAEKIFEEKGFPDFWNRWERARADARYDLRRKEAGL